MKESKTLGSLQIHSRSPDVKLYGVKKQENKFYRLPINPWLIISPLSTPCLKLCCTMRGLPFFTGGKYFYCKKRQSYFSILSSILCQKVALVSNLSCKENHKQLKDCFLVAFCICLRVRLGVKPSKGNKFDLQVMQMTRK